jgi:hypothetical protein
VVESRDYFIPFLMVLITTIITFYHRSQYGGAVTNIRNLVTIPKNILNKKPPLWK